MVGISSELMRSTICFRCANRRSRASESSESIWARSVRTRSCCRWVSPSSFCIIRSAFRSLSNFLRSADLACSALFFSSNLEQIISASSCFRRNAALISLNLRLLPRSSSMIASSPELMASLLRTSSFRSFWIISKLSPSSSPAWLFQHRADSI